MSKIKLENKFHLVDADYVQVIHTSGGYLGVRHPIGHAGWHSISILSIFFGLNFIVQFTCRFLPQLRMYSTKMPQFHSLSDNLF